MATHIELEMVYEKTGELMPRIFNKRDITGVIAKNSSGDGTLYFMYLGEEIRVKCSYEKLKDLLCQTANE